MSTVGTDAALLMSIYNVEYNGTALTPEIVASIVSDPAKKDELLLFARQQTSLSIVIGRSTVTRTSHSATTWSTRRSSRLRLTSTDAAGKTMSDVHLPTPDERVRVTCRMVADELEASSTPERRAALALEAERLKSMMRDNSQQQFDIFTEIKARISSGGGGAIYFVDAPAGTGKTTLSKALLADIRKDGDIAVATASSGIAATLMPLGRTAHSRYKLPFKPTSTSTCGFSADSRDQTRAVLKAAKVSLSGTRQAPMSHRHLYESLDRTLRDVMRCDRPFGGLVIIFLGDFRQVLPVVVKGRRQQIVDASLKSSPLWASIDVRRLTTNMRVMMSVGADQQGLAAWAEYILRVGDGLESSVEGRGPEFIKKIPDDVCLDDEPTIENLIRDVYADLPTKHDDPSWLGERAILTPKNVDVDMINKTITDIFRPGAETHELYSADSVGIDDDATMYPSEFLNGLTVSGLPPHSLRLKLGMIVMLLRNIRPAKGDCNGTRCILIISVSPRLLELEAIGTNRRLLRVPRVTCTTDDQFPFVLRRRQFPIRPAFAMTINKAQGQTLRRVGVYLPMPVFSHGQLYVAMSRVGKRADVIFCIFPVSAARLLAEDGYPGHYTKNVVYREVLRDV